MSTDEITLRPARVDDTPAVMELTSHIWEGHDYVPHVWDEWIQDTHGLIVVAEMDGELVGFSRLARLSGNEWWLQGLRVHPQFEGRRIASRLHDFIVEYWQEHYGGVVRFSTWRPQVVHLAERSGFKALQEFSLFSAPSLIEAAAVKAAVAHFQPIAKEDVPNVLKFISLSPAMDLTDGLITLGWEWHQPTEENLSAMADGGHLWWWREGRGVAATYVDTEEIERGVEIEFLFIRLLACHVDDLSAVLADVRGLGAQSGYEYTGWAAPLQKEATDALEQAGYKRVWDGFVRLFEKHAPEK